MRTQLKSRRVWVALAVVGTIAFLGYGYRGAAGGGFGGSRSKDEPQPIPKVVYVSTPVTPQAAHTWIALGKFVPMRFRDETPLEGVIQFIRESTKGVEGYAEGIPIYVDPIGLQNAEKTLQSPISIDLEGIPLETALELMLKQLGLTYVVSKDGLVTITSKPDDDDADTVIHPYPTMLNQISALRTELAALRREVSEMKRGK